MRLFHRKSKFERLIESLEASDVFKSTARTAVEAAVANASSPQQAQKVGAALDSFNVGNNGKSAGSLKRKAKSGLALAAGAAALTAASVSISSFRQKESPS